MILNASCSLNSMSDVGAHPTRRIGADVSLSCECMAEGLSPEELGGEKITIQLRGLSVEQILRTLELTTALKEPGADSKAIVDEIKQMQSDNEACPR